MSPIMIVVYITMLSSVVLLFLVLCVCVCKMTIFIVLTV